MEQNLELLDAWMNMTANIKVNRLLQDMSLNEMFICSYIYRFNKASFKQLIEKTNLLKSQMNRQLNDLIEKGFVTKNTDDKDKRKIVLEMTEKGKEVYLKEHEKVVALISRVTKELGNKKTASLAKLMKEAVGVLDND